MSITFQIESKIAEVFCKFFLIILKIISIEGPTTMSRPISITGLRDTGRSTPLRNDNSTYDLVSSMGHALKDQPRL